MNALVPVLQESMERGKKNQRIPLDVDIDRLARRVYKDKDKVGFAIISPSLTLVNTQLSTSLTLADLKTAFIVV